MPIDPASNTAALQICRTTLVSAGILLCLTGVALAATPPVVSAAVPAGQHCATGIQALRAEMEKGGYWLGESGYGYGYPMMGYSFGYVAPGPVPAGRSAAPAAASGDTYMTARPGYDIRTLLASAYILAQHGKEEACESVLATTRQVYQAYSDNLSQRGVPMADMPGWQQRQIASAKPVSTDATAIRSEQLVGTDVRNTRNELLGTVDDIVMSPSDGRIAYLVIGRGGFLGIGEHYTPVPWLDFKGTSGLSTLVLDSSRHTIDSAPTVGRDEFARGSNIDQISRKVDAYWKTNLTSAELVPAQ